MSNRPWRANNRLQLLENGEAFFSSVFTAIAAARQEVLIQTFILFEDAVGRELEAALCQAVNQGARIELTVDGYGSEALSPAFIQRMQSLGVVLRMFAPFPRLFGSRVNLFRRLHHKIVVVDGALAFVGGINFSEDHLISSGPTAKQDYAVRVEGPLVQDIRQLVVDMRDESPQAASWWRRWRPEDQPPLAAGGQAALALLARRDNHGHPDDIERLYRIGIRRARQRIVIANAYFFPGYRLLRELRRSVARGVEVQLILQGNPDMPVARFITRTLYAQLAHAGVEIFEYVERPLHAKVAVIDEDWATVGSSNLDPLSLSLNLEVNVFVIDRPFTAQLAASLAHLRDHRSVRLDADQLKRPDWTGRLFALLAYHVSRHFPTLAMQLPRRRPLQQQLAGPALKTSAEH